MIRRTPSLRELRANRGENVELLPTAAARQVRQKCNRSSRAASRALKKEHASRFDYCHHHVRRAEKDAAIIRETKMTPGLLLAMAILETLDRDQRFQVLGKLAARGHIEGNDQALAFARTTVMNVGEQAALLTALDRLAEREGASQ